MERYTKLSLDNQGYVGTVLLVILFVLVDLESYGGLDFVKRSLTLATVLASSIIAVVIVSETLLHLHYFFDGFGEEEKEFDSGLKAWTSVVIGGTFLILSQKSFFGTKLSDGFLLAGLVYTLSAYVEFASRQRNIRHKRKRKMTEALKKLLQRVKESQQTSPVPSA